MCGKVVGNLRYSGVLVYRRQYCSSSVLLVDSKLCDGIVLVGCMVSVSFLFLFHFLFLFLEWVDYGVDVRWEEVHPV